MPFMPLRLIEGETPVSWMLLTTEVINIQTNGCYPFLRWPYRWHIEEYHKVFGPLPSRAL